MIDLFYCVGPSATWIRWNWTSQEFECVSQNQYFILYNIPSKNTDTITNTELTKNPTFWTWFTIKTAIDFRPFCYILNIPNCSICKKYKSCNHFTPFNMKKRQIPHCDYFYTCVKLCLQINWYWFLSPLQSKKVTKTVLMLQE